MASQIDAILNAARTLSHEDPDWTMSRLAETAGMSRATLYRRFANRDAVIRALAETGDAPPDLRVRVLDALERVAARSGWSRVTMEAVAAEAGCGVTTLYRHFATREALFTALAEARTPLAVLGELRTDGAAPLRDVLVLLVEQALSNLEQQRALLPLAFSPDPDARSLTSHLRGLEKRGRASLAELLKARIQRDEIRGDPHLLATCLVGMIGGFALGDGRREDQESDAERIVEVFLHGCSVSGSRTEAKRAAGRWGTR